MQKAIRSALLIGSVASCGCVSGIVSQRYHEPNCDAEILNEEMHVTRGLPVMVWPTVAMPRCFTREGRQRLHQDISELLQPEPTPPLKPPHSRFHPLPTQPVFAQRAEYRQPELLGASPELSPGELAVSPDVEEIPVPVAEPLLEQPSSNKQPNSTVEEPPKARPIELPPEGDASRGAIKPASFTWEVEPNPLRAPAGTTSTHLRR